MCEKTISGLSFHRPMLMSDDDGFCQLIVDVVSAVLDGYRAAAFAMGDYRNRFAAVTSEGKQKCIQFLVIGFDCLDDVFLAFHCFFQIHDITVVSHCCTVNCFD